MKTLMPPSANDESPPLDLTILALLALQSLAPHTQVHDNLDTHVSAYKDNHTHIHNEKTSC